ENASNDGLVSDTGIDHEVIKMPVWPFLAEVLLDEIGSVVVDGVHETSGFVRLCATPDEPADLVFERRIDEDMKHVRPVLQEERAAASHDDRVALVGRRVDKALRQSEDGVGVEQVQSVHVQAAFEAAAEKQLEKPVVQGIHALFTIRDLRPLTLRETRNLVRQQLIPELPSEGVSKPFRNDIRTAAVLPIDGDNSYFHGCAYASTC